MTKEESLIISLIRLTSCFMIVACHFLQAYNNSWAFVLNVGVQIFLLISGFLYGCRGIKNISQFYKGRLKKVYLPYVIWTIFIGTALFFIVPEYFSLRHFILQLFTFGRLDGQEHLWFMQILFICYFLLPAFETIRNDKIALLMIWTIIIILFLSFIFILPNSNLLWIATYYIGYALGRWRKSILWIMRLGIICFSIMILKLSNINDFQEYNLFGHSLHIVLSIIITCGLFTIAPTAFNKLKINNLPPPIGKFEYEMYLTHHTILLGPLSIIGITHSILEETVIALLTIIVMTASLILSTKLVNKIIRNWSSIFTKISL